MQRRFFAICVALALGCAGMPVQQAVPVSPVTPRGGEVVTIDHAVLLFDASGSLEARQVFPPARAFLESFAASMPDGAYEAGGIAFGGEKRDVLAIGPFDRSALVGWARRVAYLDGTTPIPLVFAELAGKLAKKGDRAAIVLISDGQPTDSAGRSIPDENALAAAAGLAVQYRGEVCFHTVLVGSDPTGAALLQALADLSGCGSDRPLSAVADGTAIEGFAREVFFGAVREAPPPARQVEGDRDGDGVADSRDQCSGTPAGARVDERGCWVLEDLKFGLDSAELDARAQQLLREDVVPVLRRNPTLRVRVEGHTDASGAAAYNQQLSLRRAQAVRAFLVAEGVDEGRLEARGFGEDAPIAPNDTAEGRRQNRRTELTVLR